MIQKMAYAVFTLTDSGLDYLVKGNFGNNEQAAIQWKKDHLYDVTDNTNGYDPTKPKTVYADYPNGLFVKAVKY